MAAPKRPRFGSLQFYPRKRVDKFLPSVNWSVIPSDPKNPGLLGYIAYKVAMATALVKDSTDKSMTAGKKIYVPATILEAPSMKLFAVRFYKNGIPMKDVIVSSDKELKKILKVPNQLPVFDSEVPNGYDDIRVIVYSLAKQTSVKKTPDIIEVAVNAPDKLAFVKSLIGKEITVRDFMKFSLVDTRGLTTGRGFSGPVKRFGIGYRSHKAEKGQKRPGSIGPWHPARITFHVPMAGQVGMFTRVVYNNNVLTMGSISEKNINKGTGFKNYGKVSSGYIIIKGSVQGPAKRQILVTPSFRPTKNRAKKKFEFLELIQ